MSFAHLRRIVLGVVFLGAVFVLAIVVDGAVIPTFNIVEEHGVLDGPFGSVVEHVPTVAYLIVAILILGIVTWILVGPIQRTRVEEEHRRLR